MLQLPVVPGAKDYRVFAVTNGVTTNIVGTTEDVLGATITCAGLRQRNECDDTEAVKEYGDAEIIMTANCVDDVRSINVPKTVATKIEINNLTGTTDLIVEAIDRQCPFVGAIGQTHANVEIAGANTPLTTTFAGKLITFPVFQPTFPIVTEAEVRAMYGSLILNGHGPAPRPTDPLKGPYLNVAQSAPRNAPVVLNRSVITVTPTGTGLRPIGFKDTDVFDDFSDDTDQFKLIALRKDVEGVILPAGLGNVTGAAHWANSRWNRYTFNYDESQMYIDKGELHAVIADQGQDVMGSNIIYPKKTFSVPDTGNSFLHITFETQADATQRRYWWLHMCGASTPGATYSGTTFPGTSTILATPFFMDPASGGHISMAGWNCLQFVPRAGSYDVVPGGEFTNPVLGDSRSQSSMRMLVNRPTPVGKNPTTDTNSVQILDPSQIEGDTATGNGQWVRTWDSQHKINGVLLDDQLYVAQKTTFDVYVNRTQAVMYVNGVQKICDKFPNNKLTMAEAAVGLGQVFYHSSAERTELMSTMWIKTGQSYYLRNTPFVDVRSFDNLGIQESTSLPASFNAARCYTTQ
jgi:hypothetical protein